MVWIAAFAVCGAAWLLVGAASGRRGAFVSGAGVLAATVLVLAGGWVAAGAHPVDALAPSLRFLTGLHRPGDVVPSCLTWGPGAKWVLQIVVVLLLLGAAVAALVPAVAGVVGIPLGVLACLLGGVVSAVQRDAEPVHAGLRVLSAALGCFVLAALVLRLLHAVYLAVLC